MGCGGKWMCKGQPTTTGRNFIGKYIDPVTPFNSMTCLPPTPTSTPLCLLFNRTTRYNKPFGNCVSHFVAWAAKSPVEIVVEWKASNNGWQWWIKKGQKWTTGRWMVTKLYIYMRRILGYIIKYSSLWPIIIIIYIYKHWLTGQLLTEPPTESQLQIEIPIQVSTPRTHIVPPWTETVPAMGLPDHWPLRNTRTDHLFPQRWIASSAVAEWSNGRDKWASEHRENTYSVI